MAVLVFVLDEPWYPMYGSRLTPAALVMMFGECSHLLVYVSWWTRKIDTNTDEINYHKRCVLLGGGKGAFGERHAMSLPTFNVARDSFATPDFECRMRHAVSLPTFNVARNTFATPDP